MHNLNSILLVRVKEQSVFTSHIEDPVSTEMWIMLLCNVVMLLHRSAGKQGHCSAVNKLQGSLLHVLWWSCVHTRTHTRTHTHTHAHKHTLKHTYTHTNTHAYAPTHTPSHPRKHTCINTQKYSVFLSFLYTNTNRKIHNLITDNLITTKPHKI